MGDVKSMAEHRHKDSLELLEYLQEHFGRDALRGMVLQCVDRLGKERVYMTGVYRNDPARAAGACMSMSVKMTIAAGTDPP